MNAEVAWAIGITVLVMLFAGDPDLMDAIIAWIGRH